MVLSYQFIYISLLCCCISVPNNAQYVNKTHIRKEILNYLDLGESAQMIRKAEIESVPQIMKQLYRKMMRSHRAAGFGSEQDQEVVRLFFPTGQKVNRGSALNYEFPFNMFSVRGKKEKITEAELRLFKRRYRSNTGPWWCSIAVFLQRNKRKNKRKSGKSKKRDKSTDNPSESTEEIFAGVKVIPLIGKSRWLTFNVSKVVKDQFEKHRDKKVVFKVYVVTYGGTLPRKSWISRRGEHRPNLVVYSRLKQRKPRGTLSLDLKALADTLSLKSRAKRGNKNQYCQRRRLYVKFRSLKIDWIVAPVGFSAYVCDGTCPEVLTSYYNPNNHAIIQNLLHYRYSKEIPLASCVPTSLNALTILYADVGNSFALKEFPDMIVSNCGCR